MYCGECKEECEGEWVDFGIGGYEYWGFRGNDVQWAFVSKCCEGDVYQDKECKVRYEPDPDCDGEDDYPEPDYDDREETHERDWITREEKSILEANGIDTDDMEVRDV